jgi:hypothetical protein
MVRLKNNELKKNKVKKEGFAKIRAKRTL